MRLQTALLMSAAAAFAQPANPRVRIENEHVRVLVAEDLPHSKSALHRHEINRVMVYLSAGEQKISYQDGTVDQQKRKPGQVAWSPAGGMHISENLSGNAIRIVEVELKHPPSGKPFQLAARDPLKVNAKHCSQEFENPQVRVLRCKYPTNDKEPMHEHLSLGRVTVQLNDTDLKVTTQGAVDQSVSRKAGDVSWSAGPVVHSAQTSRAAEMIIVELK